MEVEANTNGTSSSKSNYYPTLFTRENGGERYLTSPEACVLVSMTFYAKRRVALAWQCTNLKCLLPENSRFIFGTPPQSYIVDGCG